MPDDSQSLHDVLTDLCQQVAEQVAAQRDCIHAGNPDAAASYVGSILALLAEVQAHTEQAPDALRERSHAALSQAVAVHADNVALLEQAAEVMRKNLIEGRDRSASIGQYERMQKRRRPGK